MRFAVLVLFLILGIQLFAQEQPGRKEGPKVMQFTGVVFTPDSTSVIPGVHVYVPKGGRGTTTNPYGFFSMPVLEGDSVVFSAVGFKKQHYIVPANEGENSLKVIVTLQEDVTFLNEVEVFPYPTEAMFKEAVLALEAPYQQQYNNMNAWLHSDYMSTAYRNLPNSANINHRYYMESMQTSGQGAPNNLLNPFAWAKFIKSLKGK